MRPIVDICNSLVPSHVSAADHEDISRFGRCTLKFEGLLDFRNRNFMVADGRGRFAMRVFVLIPAKLYMSCQYGR